MNNANPIGLMTGEWAFKGHLAKRTGRMTA